MSPGPTSLARPDARSTSAGPAAVAKLPPPWILVADDDDLVRTLWIETLTQAGYRTVGARTGREAIELMRTVVPDLMILDLRMPDLAGDAVLLHLQHTPILRRIPVLIVSGFLDDDRVGADFGLNIVSRLPKPITLTRLREAVAAALAGPPPPPSST